MAQSLLFFNDTSVLISFAIGEELDLLHRVLGEKGRWTATIRAECRRQGPNLGFPLLADEAERILGAPLFPSDDEHRPIRDLRMRMSAPGEHPDEHLGEAEVLTIIERRRLPALFVTEDQGAVRMAHGVRCIDTWDIIGVALKGRFVEASRVWEFRRRLMAAKRVAPTHRAEIFDEAQFRAWSADHQSG